MKNYWSCSKFADWLRGTAKPEWCTVEAWDPWEAAAKKTHPVRYWLAEEGLDRLRDIIFFIPDKLYALKYYINNRWVTSTHTLTAHPSDIRRGDWCDVGNRFLPCLFNELVEFVEVELAWWHIAWSDSERKKKYSAPFWASGWFRWRTWRCPQAGLDNLEWQASLVYDENMGIEPSHKLFGKPTTQADKAREILALYNWWKCERPSRPDPYDASGWTDFCARMTEKYGPGLGSWNKRTKAEKTESTRINKIQTKMEEQYEREDEDMMIRLIKIRNGLWT